MTSFESAHSTVDPKAGGGANDVSSGTEHRRARVRTEFRNSVSGLSSFKHQEVHHLHGDPKSKKKSATDYKNKVFGESSSFSQIGGYGGRDSLKLNRVDFKKSITDIHMTPLRPQSTSIPEGKDKLSGENTSSNNNSQEENLLYSAMQKLLEYESSNWINAIRNYMIKPNPRNTDDHSRNSSFSCFSGVSTHWSNPRLSKFKGSYKFPTDKCFDLKEHSYNNNEACSDTELPMDNYEIINEVSYPDLPAFYERQLYRITEIETIKMSMYESQEKEPEKPPYKYHEIDWKHPVVPMCVISLRAFCIELETPTELLSFEQIEQYLRSIDPEVPPNQLWSTLIPLRMKLKTGEIKVQMRDISIPLFLIPDPFFSEDQAEIENRQKQSYRNFRCGLKVEGCFIFSEQRALEKSLRLSSFTVDKIPAPHLSTETLNDLSSVGEYSDTEKTVLLPWFVSKSFMFPRIHSRLSFIIYTAATDKSAAANDIIRSGNLDGHSQSEFTRELLTSLINLRRFPTSSPIVCWGQRVQPTIVSFSQRFESLSSSSGEPSPHIGWWDKLRSRAKIQLRALLVDVDLDELATSDSFRLSNEYKIGRRGRNRPVEHTSELLFYTPGGRDPHNYAVENRGYLFSFRGGVRLSIGEGDLETSGVCKIFKKNIVINQGNGSRSEVGIAAKMSENIRIKCRTFLCGVPGIEEEMRNAELVLKSAVMYNPGYKHRDYSLKADQEMFQNLRHQMLAASKIFIGRFGRLSSNNYMFLKVLGELNSGVRISLGTSFEIQERIHLNTFIGKDECQNSQSLENGTENEYKSYISKWEILPHAPENIPSALKDVYDAYSGFRSSGIDLGISILSPFEAESAPSTNPAVVPTSTHTEAPQEVREFECNDSEHIGVNTSEIKNDWIHDFSNFTTTSQSKGIKTLASADNEIQPSPVLPYDDENESYRGYSAERHIPQRSAKTATKMASVGPSFGGRAKRSGSRDGPGDPDYTKRNMAPNPRDSHVYDATVGDDREETDSEYFMSMDSKDRDIFTPGPIKTFAFLQSTRSITKPRSRWHDRRIFLLSPLHKCEFGDHMGTQDMYFGAFVKRSDMSNAFKDERSVNISLITSKHFMSYLSLFASRLNLPVKKGRMYPERSTKDIKFGKVLRSVRLGIDFRDFELCHSLQISQVKEMGLKEFDELKIFTNPQLKLSELLKNMTNLDEMTNSRFSDISSPYEIKASKVEGDIFQVKARAKFLQASLLAVQKRVKTVLNTKSSSSSLSSIIGEKASKKKIIFQWGIPRIDADVDNIDVRLIKMSYRLPVFVNSDNGLEADSKSDYWGGNIVNGIRLTKSAESIFIEKPHLASWINLKSLQDPTHFNLNHATFYDANVLCFLTAPRLVYFIKDEVESLAKKTAERLDAQYASLNLASNDVESHQGKMRMNSASLAEVGTDLDRSTNIKKFTSSHSLSKGYLLNNTSKDKEETIPTNSLKNSVMKQKNTSRTESSLDHRKILRDSRLTQAILLCRRKERLGMAIEMNELRQRKLMEAFEFGADIEYEESTTQNALEIYDLCFRRRLINRCMSLLGISPEKITSENLVDQINDSLSSSTPGMTQAKEARELESKYRHRFLLYSAYLIWTSQIRDISMKLFYNEDTWLAMEYFISQTAAKVVSDLSNRNASEEGIKAETLSSSKPGKNTVQKSRDLANRHARRFQSDSSFQKPSELSEPVQSSENTGADFVTDSNTKNIDSSIFADNIDKFVPIYNALIEFLNSQLSFRIDESSVDAVVASVEKAQLHMIKLYSDEILGRSASSLETTITRDPTPSIDMGGSVSVFEELDKDDNDNSKTFAIGKDSRREAPNIYRLTGFSSSRNKTNNRMIDTTVEVNYEEHLVKTRMLAELTNMQMFSVKKEDFVKCPIYLIDCSYGSDVADLTNTTGTLWPAWVPIEILLTPEFTQTELIKNSASKDDKTHKASILAEGRRLLKQYSRFLDRSSAIILYDRVNPHRIKDVDTAEHEDEDILDQQSEKATAESSDAAELDCVQSEALESINSNLDKVDDSAPLPSSKSSKKSLKSGKSNSTNKRSPAPLPNTGSSAAGNSNRGKATYVGVYMSHINVASTSAQYRLLFDMISQLFVYNEPGKVEYLDELNSIILSTDLASIYNAGPTVVRLQDQLRVRKRLIEEWVQKQWEDSLQHSSFNDNSVVIANGKANQLHTVAQLSLESFQHVISNLDKARSVLILSRQINVLEHQLRITMDLVSAAQKKISMLARSSTRHLSGLTPGSNSSSQIIRPDSQISDRNELANELASYTLSEQNKPPMLSKTQANSRANTFTSGNDTSLPADYDESIDDIPGDQNKEYGTKKSKYDWSFWKSLSRRKSQDRLRRADTASDGNRLFNHRSISDDHLGTKSTRSHQDPLPTPPKSIARYITANFSYVNWRMLDDDSNSICDLKLRNLGAVIETTTSQSNDIVFEIDLVVALSRVPDSKFPEMIMPFAANMKEPIDFSKNKMLRVVYSQLAPVGGINIVENLEIDMSPIRIQLSYDIGSMMIEYFFPKHEAKYTNTAKSQQTSTKNTAESKSTGTGASTLDSSATSITKGRPGSIPLGKKGVSDFDETRSIKSSTTGVDGVSQAPSRSANLENHDQQQQQQQSKTSALQKQKNENLSMKDRASSNYTFIHVKMQGHPHIITYRGPKRKNITDLTDFQFNSPTIELRNEVLSYYELLMKLKKAFIGAAVQHTGALFREKVKQLRGAYPSKNEKDALFNKRLVEQINEDEDRARRSAYYPGNADTMSINEEPGTSSLTQERPLRPTIERQPSAADSFIFLSSPTHQFTRLITPPAFRGYQGDTEKKQKTSSTDVSLSASRSTTHNFLYDEHKETDPLPKESAPGLLPTKRTRSGLLFKDFDLYNINDSSKLSPSSPPVLHPSKGTTDKIYSLQDSVFLSNRPGLISRSLLPKNIPGFRLKNKNGEKMQNSPSGSVSLETEPSESLSMKPGPNIN
ncbi:UPF0648 protein [Zancudomyces culisetae]|uniref:UPF0648 protein n=1 Tax=Zancudomyces culisetae TaxID=1213189 RepID=A0A1R1PV93_ZANCU|nr:UPF0648 protein [Zancudomyces culisetae]|eukprot:OMH84874.1 UPF0648 protein [Zancudomyces culisetae]